MRTTTDYNWLTRWREGGVPDSLRAEFIRRYMHLGPPPEELTEELERNDGKCGLGALTFGRDKHCERHDWYHIFQKHGYPLEPLVKTQLRFLGDKLAQGAQAVIAPVFGVVGAVVGTALMLGRKRKEKDRRY
jgi:hypothetical protein